MVVLGWKIEIGGSVGSTLESVKTAKALASNSSEGIIPLPQKPTHDQLEVMFAEAVAGIALEAAKPHPKFLAE